jgi:hypothetical protein
MEHADVRDAIKRALAEADMATLRRTVTCLLDLIAHTRTAARAAGQSQQSFQWTYRLELEILRKLDVSERHLQPIRNQLKGA